MYRCRYVLKGRELKVFHAFIESSFVEQFSLIVFFVNFKNFALLPDLVHVQKGNVG